MGYRNLRMHPALQPPPSSPSPRQQRAHGDLAQPWPQAASQQEHQPSSVNSSHDGQPGARQLSESAVPSLLDQCQAALLSDLSAGSVCEVLQVADCLSPVVDGLRRWAGLGEGHKGGRGRLATCSIGKILRREVP